MNRSAASALALLVSSVTIATSGLHISADTQLPAFPSAEGFGALSLGGRGGSVIEVTNLEDSGPGSLRDALQAPGPRTVVFRTGGTIALRSPIVIREPYLTIAGQTAPGDGIAVRNDPQNWTAARTPIVVATHNVIIRYLRIRPGVGDGAPKPWAGGAGVDGLRIAGASPAAVHDVIIDHSSVSWALDENVQVGENAQNVTVQWSIVSEGLDKSVHPDGAHSRGLLATGTSAQQISIHHNLFAHNEDRNPQISLRDRAEVFNNVVYDYRFKAISSSDAGADTAIPVGLSIRGNFVKRGPDSTRNHREVDLFPTLAPSPGWRLHLAGNIGPFRTGNTQAEADALNPEDLAAYLVSSAPLVSPDTSPTEPAGVAYDQVLDEAGATVPARDAVDERTVEDVRNGAGGLIDSPAEVGGWPNLATGTAPTDTDHDGMPDPWETSNGLDPNHPGDGAETSPSGYTWLEEYLNELADEPAAGEEMQVGALTSGGTSADARTYSTASFSPPSDRLVVAFVANSVGSGTAKTPTLAGNDLTWEMIKTSTDSSALRRVTAYRAFGSSPASGPLTIGFSGQTQARAAWSIVTVSATAGSSASNGADAIRQPRDATGSGTTGSVILPDAPAGPGSRPLAAFWHAATNSSTPRPGWVEIHDLLAGTEALSLQSQWRSDAFEQTSSASWSSKVRWGGIAFELRSET